jgi:hypothetical protein
MKINLTRQNFRAVIYYDVKSSVNPKRGVERLRSALSEEAHFQRSIYIYI